MKYSVIDIGTNTILMLIAEKGNGGMLSTIQDIHRIARLGEGLSQNNNYINNNAILRATNILEEYKNVINEYNICQVKIVSTSALRDANNTEEVKEQLQMAIDNPIEIISGEEEAKYSYFGAIQDDTESIVIDIGGGSTEIVYGNGSNVISRQSFQIGAVRLTDMFLKNNPPTYSEVQSMSDYINEIISTLNYRSNPKKVYAVAGTPTTLAAVDLKLDKYDRDKIEGHILKLENIKQIFNIFKKIEFEEIINKYHVHPDRADVILAGTQILISILELISADKCIATTKGLRYGVMKSIIY